MWASRVVFRCFKCMERTADQVTGKAGPVFVSFAIILLSLGIFSFFDVIAPSLPLRIVTTPLCGLIACNILAHYYWACTVPPGFSDEHVRLSGTRSRPEGAWMAYFMAPERSRQLDSGEQLTQDDLLEGRPSRCNKCGSIKPERTHHCRICKRCVLKYDHHCPVVSMSSNVDGHLSLFPRLREGINQCVGINNERHFILFMAYVSLGTFCFVILGFPASWELFNVFSDWPYYTPKMAFMLIYIVCIALGVAIGAMLAWHLWLVIKGQTTVENHDATYYKKVAKKRGEVFINCYDLGARENLKLFFNVTSNGHPWWVLLTPLRTKPYTSGHAWIRRPGYENGHGGVRGGEELTDEDDDE